MAQMTQSQVQRMRQQLEEQRHEDYENFYHEKERDEKKRTFSRSIGSFVVHLVKDVTIGFEQQRRERHLLQIERNLATLQATTPAETLSTSAGQFALHETTEQPVGMVIDRHGDVGIINHFQLTPESHTDLYDELSHQSVLEIDSLSDQSTAELERTAKQLAGARRHDYTKVA